MKSKLSLIALVCLCSVSSFASISGRWFGWVNWISQGQGPRCEIELRFTEQADSLNRLGGFVDCGIITVEIGELQLTKKNQQLLQNGIVVGSFDENNYHWKEQYNEDVSIDVSITRDGKHFQYHEVWIEDDGSLLYDVNGRLIYSSNMTSMAD